MSSDLTAIAIIPGLLIFAYVYKKDKVEKEPMGLIIKTIALGAASCLLAAFLEHFEQQLLPPYQPGTIEYAAVTGFLVAGLVEECVKFLAMFIFTWRYVGFNYRFDGIVYGTAAAIGFAVFENITYVYQFGLYTGIVRAFTAVPLHASCGVYMGVLYAYAKKEAILGRSPVKFFLLSILVPMLIHGTYDMFAFMGQPGMIPLYVMVVIMYIVTIRLINKMSRADFRSGFYPEARNLEIDIDRY